MENGNNQQYNDSITVRLDKTLKDKITKEAQQRNMSVSDYLRTFLSSAELPDALLLKLPKEYRESIEKLIAREANRGKSRYDILSRLFSQIIMFTMDNGHGGFVPDFRRR